MNVIGPRVREIREAKKLTQDELAARCNLLGWNISRGTLAKIEAKVRRVTDVEVALLARALQVDVSVFYQETRN
ncbi:MAG: helix-turn-helix transcriptional regulator [Vulcanimicrobiota bacterium]